MSDDLEEAAGAILGLAIGGILLLEMAAELNSTSPVNFTTWGTIFLVAAVLTTILLVIGVLRSIME